MPSSYTQNLGIERPATGEQANTWGDTVNRNMDTLDTAINGNVQLALSTSPYQLSINNGATSPVAANPVIIWNGAQTQQGTVEIDWQASRQHLYIMSNQTSGGFPIAFAQGSGNRFVLQAGYDAIIYADGRGSGASVAAALANPQFNNLLVSGSLSGVSSLGLGHPASTPDALTINGLGAAGFAQLRLVDGNYGVIFRNDGSQFFLMVTNAGDPYGGWGAWSLEVDLASGRVGLGGWGPDTVHALNVPTIHTAGMAVDGAISVGGGVNITGGRSYFNSGESYTIGLEYGSSSLVTYIGTNAANQFQVSNGGGVPLLTVDQGGNVIFGNTVTAYGLIHVTSGGIMFPDGSVQTSAVVGSFTSVSTPGRAIGGVYRNTSGRAMLITVTLIFSVGVYAVAQAFSDSGANPTLLVSEIQQLNPAQYNLFPITFVVLAGHYYKITGQGITIAHWTEWF